MLHILHDYDLCLDLLDDRILLLSFLSFFFNDTATTEIYTLSLHDALPISPSRSLRQGKAGLRSPTIWNSPRKCGCRSEEHTSELQSPCNLVCRLLLEKKKNKNLQLAFLVGRLQAKHNLRRRTRKRR